MTRPAGPAVQQAQADVPALFRTTPAADPAGLYAMCRAARGRPAARPILDPHETHDPREMVAGTRWRRRPPHLLRRS